MQATTMSVIWPQLRGASSATSKSVPSFPWDFGCVVLLMAVQLEGFTVKEVSLHGKAQGTLAPWWMLLLEYFGSMDETCEVYFAHYERIVLEMHDGACPAGFDARAHQRERETWLALPDLPCFHVGGSGCRSLDGADGQAQERTYPMGVVDDCWLSGDGGAGLPRVVLTCAGAFAGFGQEAFCHLTPCKVG